MMTAAEEVAKAIRDGLPVLRSGKAIEPGQAPDLTSLAQSAKYFATIDEKYINDLARYAKRKVKKGQRLRWWQITGDDGGDFSSEYIGQYYVLIRNHHQGRTVERSVGLSGDFRILTFMGCPVLFPTLPTAGILVEAFFPDPPPGLVWAASEAETAINSIREGHSSPAPTSA